MIDVHVSTSQLGDLLGALAHPHRLQLVLALCDGAHDAAHLSSIMGTSKVGVVEHLRVLRAHHVVTERRDGNHVQYELTWPGVVDWLGMALAFVEGHHAPTPGRLVELPKVGSSI